MDIAIGRNFLGILLNKNITFGKENIYLLNYQLGEEVWIVMNGAYLR